MQDPLAEARALFDPLPGSAYLDAATYGLPPRPTAEVMQRAIGAWQSGAADWVRDWDMRGEDCRAAFATIIGTRSENLALVPTASIGVANIAASLTPRDEVVVTDDEFTSVVYPLLVAAEQHGASIRVLPFEQIAANITASTTLVAFSLVQGQTGRTAPLGDILDACIAAGARSLVDATHGIPFVDVRDEIDRVDYLVCAAYKHLLSPRGVSFLYIAQKHWDAVPPVFANWRSSAKPYASYYGPPLDLAPDAARFDVSLAWLAWVGAAESLQLIAQWQARGLLQPVRELARELAERLGVARPAGNIVVVPVDDAESVRARLAQEGVRASVRAGGVRLSPHVYNTREDIDRAVAALSPSVRTAVLTPR